MLAIHNLMLIHLFHFLVANAFAKLSKCQQFTTVQQVRIQNRWLQTLLQSYQNVSNSQQLMIGTCHFKRCKRFCKVIKMLAIHNKVNEKKEADIVANAFAKLSKCQQFTTLVCQRLVCHLLQTLLQSYQNVSNSQLLFTTSITNTCCKRFCKVIKMLAIHNHSAFSLTSTNVANAFAKLSKCQQFTTYQS